MYVIAQNHSIIAREDVKLKRKKKKERKKERKKEMVSGRTFLKDRVYYISRYVINSIRVRI